MHEQSQIIIVLVSYFLILVLWGVYQGRKVKTGEDYSIAGRRLPGWVAALSERATGESSWALLGLPGVAYSTGLVEIWTAVGCVFGIITAWIFLAWRLRDEAEKYKVNTFSDFLAKKHSELGNAIRIMSSFTIVFFFFFYVGAQFIGGGKTLHTLFGINPAMGMFLTALIIVPYTIYGGFRSVVYADVIQAIIMIITLIVCPVMGIIYLRSHPELFAQSIGMALRKAGDGYMSLTGMTKGIGSGLVIMTGFSWFFGYLGGQPQLSTRFMAIRDIQQAKLGRNVGIIWTIIAYVGALCIGWIGIAIFGPGVLKDQEYVMPSVVLHLFPSVIAAILIAGAIAAMVSTADSLLILSATELSENLIKPLMKAYKKREISIDSLLISRMVTGLLALIALVVAYFSPTKLIFTIVGWVWAGVGGTFSVVVILTLFWKRFHSKAALVSIVVGLVFTIIWGVFGLEVKITARILTFFVTGIVAIIATLVVKK